MEGIVVTHLTVILSVIRVFVWDSENSVMRFTDWLSLSSDWVSFMASATIIAMTMSVFEFSEPGNTDLRLHSTYQTSHGRTHCPILMSLILSSISNTRPNNSEQFWTWGGNTATANNPGWVIGTDTVTASVSHIASFMEYLVHTVATVASVM